MPQALLLRRVQLVLSNGFYSWDHDGQIFVCDQAICHRNTAP